MELGLENKVVVDLTNNVAGPFCTWVLAQLGADVIKIERPGSGDDTRGWGPPFWNGHSPMFLSLNRDKRSLALNLRSTEGKHLLERMLSQADVLVQSFRPPVARRLGIDNDSVRARHPHLIVCAVSAFGRSGPRRDEPGYDPLIQAFSGIMSITGEANGSPVRAGTSILDLSTGLWSALGVLTGVMKRSLTGSGVCVNTSLLESAISMLSSHIAGYLATNINPVRRGTELAILAPYGAFRASDGLILIAVGSEALWTKFCAVLEAPSLAEDPRFRVNADRVNHRTDLKEMIEVRLSQRTVDEWLPMLANGGVPASPVNTVADALADPQTNAVAIIQDSPTDDQPDLRLVGLPVEWQGSRPPPRRPPPSLGEHSSEVLRQFGLVDEEIEKLISAGLVEQKALAGDGS